MGKMLAKRVCVVIERDVMERISRVVWEHEVPILQTMYGEGMVTVEKIPDETYIHEEDMQKMLDAEVEYGRLVNAYAPDETGKPLVEYVYGPKFHRGLEKQYPVNGEREIVANVRKTTTDSDENEGPDDTKVSLDGNENGYVDRDEIKAMLKKYDVDFDGRANREGLEATLRDWLEEELIAIDVDYNDDATTSDLLELYEAHKDKVIED